MQRDFFDDRFDAPGDALYLLGGLLSAESRQAMSRSVKRLGPEIDEFPAPSTGSSTGD